MQRKRGSEASSGRGVQDEKAKKSFARGLRDLVATNRRRLAQKRAKAAEARAGAAGQDGAHAPAVTAAVSVAPARKHCGAAGNEGAEQMAPQDSPLLYSGGGGAAATGTLSFDSLPSQLTLQLFPVDDTTLLAVAEAGWNPHLELTFRCGSSLPASAHMIALEPLTRVVFCHSARKSLASLLGHLASKWAGAPARMSLPATATLRLFPLAAATATPDAGWGSEAGALLASELLRSQPPAAGTELPPGVFQLKYGWTVPPPAAAAALRPPATLARPEAPFPPPAPPPPLEIPTSAEHAHLQTPHVPAARAHGGFMSLLLDGGSAHGLLGVGVAAATTASGGAAFATPVTPALGGPAAAAPQHAPGGMHFQTRA